MNGPLTIVLPVHNAERWLREAIVGILDLAEILGRRIRIAVVDDGSTDGTFEAAAELAREFPQVLVMHQSAQRGVGEALEQVRLRLGVDQVISHDGVAQINLDELATLLIAMDENTAPAVRKCDAEQGSRRVTESAMRGGRRDRAAYGGASFRWLRLDAPATPRRRQSRPLAARREADMAGEVEKGSAASKLATIL